MRISGIIFILIFAIIGAWQSLDRATSTPTAAAPEPTLPAPATEVAPSAAATTFATPESAQPAEDLVVHDVSIYDLDGNLAYQGDVDLGPTLDRIARGESDPHANDGAVFQNREGLLPHEKSGYYHEYVVRTPGLDSVGPQRLILGADGEVYYTPDHYATFTRIR